MRFRKRLVCTAVLCAMVWGITASAIAADGSFTDVPGSHWAGAAIEEMCEKKIVAGYPDGTFKPQNTITYGEFIKLAVVAATGGNSDMTAADNWAMGYYNTALAKKYFTKYDIADYQLDREIPRGDMAVVVSGILGDAEIAEYDDFLLKITDVNARTPNEFAIVRVYSSGILTGYPDQTFRPEGTLSRAEAATVVHRMLKYRAGELFDNMATQTTGAKSVKERMDSGKEDSPILNLVTSSTSRLPISDIIQNTSDFILMHGLKYYEIIEECPYNMTIEKDLLGTEIINAGSIDYSRAAVLIKDNNAIYLSPAPPYYFISGAKQGAAFSLDFDYIGFWAPGKEVMLVFPNPFI